MERVIKTKVAVVGGGPVGLMMSKLLRSYAVPHWLIEKHPHDLHAHPKAHYLNARTMEILRSCSWRDYEDVVRASPPSVTWRDFSYCHTVTGTELTRQDHLRDTPSSFWRQSPTTVLHLPQHKFEQILSRNSEATATREVLPHLADERFLHLHEYRAEQVHTTATGASLSLSPVVREPTHSERERLRIDCDFVVAANGAHSNFRAPLGVHMEGEGDMQHLTNVHFSCPGLHEKLSTRPAMLYFVFNQKMVAVYVAHDPQRDEWVCQIPFFPPHDKGLEHNQEEVLHLLRETLFPSSAEGAEMKKKLGSQIKIHRINTWVMHAEVADHFVDPKHGRVFFAGDAAHRFPPAGGFGMNTGLQDVHNLAWKIAHTVHEQNDSSAKRTWLAKSYEKERKKIAQENTLLSMKNYRRTTDIAASVGADVQKAELAVKAASKLPFGLGTSVFPKLMDVGLTPLKLLEHFSTNPYGQMCVDALRKIVSQKRSLPLIFPQEDLSFSYLETTPEDAHCFLQQAGQRVKHQWLFLGNHCVLSTVDLPQMAWNLVRSRSLSASQPQPLPPFVLLLPKSSENDTLSSLRTLLSSSEFAGLRDKLFLVVINDENTVPREKLHDLLNVDLSPESSANWHDAVQAAAQVPLFDIDRKNAERHIVGGFFKFDGMNQEKSAELENAAGDNFKRTRDLLFSQEQQTTSRLFCEKTLGDAVLPAVEAFNVSGKDNLREIALLRPDGHVSIVCAADASLERILRTMKSELGH